MADQDDSTRDAHGRRPEARVMRLLDEFLNRRVAGEAPSEEALLAAHPEYADELREHLELVRHLQPRQQRIEELLARGILQPSVDGTAPAQLDGYHIHGVLGEGGMGVVLDGHDPQLDRHVALKILRPDLANDSLTLARFEREAKAAGALQHPNVLTIHGVGRDRGVRYIVMERVHGPSLAQVLGARGALPSVPARAIFRQILDGLAAAHEAGLIHRDIKSSNILLAGGFKDPGIQGSEHTGVPAEPSPEREPLNPRILESWNPLAKIADFGLARMQSSRTQLTIGDSILGTPEYMSPEQARGDTDIDRRTDLYSAGVVLYEMLTGRTPFRADTPTATIRRILDEDPTDPREMNKTVDPVLASIALRLMSKRPEDRFASAAGALTALAADQPVPVQSNRSPVVRRPLSRLLWPAALALVALVVAWGAWQGAPAERVVREAHVADDPLSKKRYVRVLYEGASGFELFPADIKSPSAAVAVDCDGSGKPIVIVGLEHPTDGFNLIAFDAAGNRIPQWQMLLHDPSGRHWPDCSQSAEWACVGLAAGDLLAGDGKKEEIVAVASDRIGHPTRISVIDPRTRRVQSTFWHLGNIEGVSVWPCGIDDGRSAIVAWGFNNALDGFGDPPPPDDKLRGNKRFPATYGFVPVVMILDPTNMNGQGPPSNARPELRDLPPANLHAYAFLDMPGSKNATYYDKDESRYVNPEPNETYHIRAIDHSPCPSDDGKEPWLQLTIGNTDGPDPLAIPVQITADRRLAWRGVTRTQGAPNARTDDFWRARWHRIAPLAEDVPQ